jgi:hypothetical protein
MCVDKFHVLTLVVYVVHIFVWILAQFRAT